jgi:hypothetical protein
MLIWGIEFAVSSRNVNFLLIFCAHRTSYWNEFEFHMLLDLQSHQVEIEHRVMAVKRAMNFDNIWRKGDFWCVISISVSLWVWQRDIFCSKLFIEFENSSWFIVKSHCLIWLIMKSNIRRLFHLLHPLIQHFGSSHLANLDNFFTLQNLKKVPFLLIEFN